MTTSSSDIAVTSTFDRLAPKFLAWCGPVYLVGILAAWGLVAGFIPPPHQDWSPERVSAFFEGSSTAIRLGMEVTITLGPLYFLWSLGIMRLMRNRRDPDRILSTTQLFGGAGTAWITVVVGILWLTAAFRSGDRDPRTVQLLNDLAWMVFDLTVTVLWTQILAVGAWIVLQPKNVRGPFPQWVAWLSAWVAFSFPAVMVMPFFNTGPFAWNGLITFWAILGEFFLWMAVIAGYVVVDAHREQVP